MEDGFKFTKGPVERDPIKDAQDAVLDLNALEARRTQMNDALEIARLEYEKKKAALADLDTQIARLKGDVAANDN